MQPLPWVGGIVAFVVVGGGGGGVVAVWVVVTGGGGGGAVAVWVVVTGGGGGAVVAVWVVITGAALCSTSCTWCLGFGLAAVVVVAVVELVEVGVVVVAVVAAAAALELWVDEEDADPHALTSSVSRTAASGMRMCLMCSRTPSPTGCFPNRSRRRGSEQAVNPPPARSKRGRTAETIRGMEDHVRGSVLVVDDEPTITEVVARYLNRAGYATRVAATGREALDAASSQRPDLVVLDLMLPGIDGLEVMRRLRDQARDRIAVILLTAKSEESDRVIGLRLGADDYVVKPFSPAELVARVDAVLRRVDSSRAQEAVIELNEMTIDPTARRLYVRGDEVQLTHREFEVLLFLARHPGQAFSRNQLMDAVWQYSFYTDTSTVTVHIRRLRAKIEVDPARPEHIQTVWGVGYRFQP
jgi:two-component system, OmpR family, response regulator ResD